MKILILKNVLVILRFRETPYLGIPAQSVVIPNKPETKWTAFLFEVNYGKYDKSKYAMQ